MFDVIGGYHYEEGWCARDAFRCALGDDHPIVAALPYEPTLAEIAQLCQRYGFEHSFEPFTRTFQRGDSVIWVLGGQGQRGHMVFCRDPQRVLNARARGECLIAGYVLVEDA